MKAAVRILIIIVLALIIFGFLPLELLLIPYKLLTGWLPASNRLVMAWQPHLREALFFALAVGALVAGSHAFLRWLSAHARGRNGNQPPPKWYWKWTACGFGILFLTLLAIGSFILTTHQIYWFSKSDEKAFTNARHETIESLKGADRLQNYAETCHWDTGRTRAYFLQMHSVMEDRPALEELEAVWVEKDSNTLLAVVLIPRHPLIRDRTPFAVIQPGGERATYKLDELQEVLHSFGLGPVAGGKTSLAP